jgi:uncharacterized membrane protein
MNTIPHTTRRLGFALACGTLTFAVATQAGKPAPPPPPSYTLTQLSGLPGFTTCDAEDVNDFGQVVGRVWTVNGPWHAVVWETASAAPTDLDNGSDFSEAYAINNAGQVVGRCRFVGGASPHPAVWIPDGLGGYAPTDLIGDVGLDGSAYDINDSGFVAGYFRLDGASMGFVICPETDANGVPVTWFRDGNGDGVNDLMFLLEPQANADGVEPYAINDLGWVVGKDFTPSGYGAFVIIPDDTLPNPWFADGDGNGINDLMVHLDASLAKDVNNARQIVASDDWSWDSRMFTVVVAPNGSITITTTTLPKPNSMKHGPSSAINDRGQVAGTGQNRTRDLDNRPLLWEPGKGTRLLESLLSDLAEFNDLDTASAINERGQIVGEGTTSAGQRVYLATPILPQ